MESTQTKRRIERVRHELKRREVTVVNVQALKEDFISVTFASEDLRDFPSASFDDHVKLIIPTSYGDEIRRDFTPRSFDTKAGLLTLEFALHGHGPACDWARKAAVGQRAAIAGPRGSMIVPMDYRSYVLAGDASALPAIKRRLAELPRGARVIVALLSKARMDIKELPTQASINLHQSPVEEDWLTCQRDLPPAGEDCFAWCATEATLAARVRKLWFEDLAFAREHSKISAYWKQGSADFHEQT